MQYITSIVSPFFFLCVYTVCLHISTQTCPLPACENLILDQPILGCNTRMQALTVDQTLIVNGTACFNGSLITCSGLTPCICWNGSLCTGLSSPDAIPSSCTLDEGELLFNATAPELITFALISRTTKNNVNASCKLAAIQVGDIIRLIDTDNGDSFANLEVTSRIASGSFYGFQLTGTTGIGTFTDDSCICLDNFGPVSSSTGSTAGGLGNYIFIYKTTAQNANTSWTNITFNIIGTTDGSWALNGSTQLVCPADGTYDIEYNLQYALNQLTNDVEAISTRILENGTEIPGSQGAIIPFRDGDFSPGRPQRCLTRRLVRQLSAGDTLNIQHLSFGIVGFEGRIQPGGTSEVTPVGGSVSIVRIE